MTKTSIAKKKRLTEMEGEVLYSLYLQTFLTLFSEGKESVSRDISLKPTDGERLAILFAFKDFGLMHRKEITHTIFDFDEKSHFVRKIKFMLYGEHEEEFIKNLERY